MVVTDNEGIAGTGAAQATGGAGAPAPRAMATVGPVARATVAPGAGGDVLGAGIYNGGALTIRASTVSANTATAGNGGDAQAAGGSGGAGGASAGDGGVAGDATATGASGGDAVGAGIYNAGAGTLTIVDSTVNANATTAGDGGDATARRRRRGAGGSGARRGAGGDGGDATATGGPGGRCPRRRDPQRGHARASQQHLERQRCARRSRRYLDSYGAAAAGRAAAGGRHRGNATAAQGPGGIARGGGIDNLTGAGTAASMRSATIAANGSPVGANLNSSGTLTIANSIVATPLGGGASCGGTVTTGGFNIDSETSCGFTQPGDQQATDPQLGQLQDNGGPTATRALVQTSPAVDQGNGGGLTTDQRAAPRPFDVAGSPTRPGAMAPTSARSSSGRPHQRHPGPGPGPLTVELKTKRKQPGERLRAKVTCSKDCDVTLRGKGKADGERFKTRAAKEELEAGVPAKLKLRLKPKDRDEVEDERARRS